MDYIHRLPFIISCILAIIIGLAGFINREANQTIYIKMAICLIVFYLLGVYARNTLKRTIEEVEEKIKKEEEEKREQEILEKQKSKADNETSEKLIGANIDLKADDYGDDFTPLKVSEAIKTAILQDTEKTH